jgi:WD40 repeat protein/mono/diheme cytochrome c family protein
MRTFRWTLILFLVAGPTFAAEPSPAAKKAHNVLQAHCYRCHGAEGNVEGGMNYVTDLDRLVARKKVVAGKPDASPLFKRVVAGTMPPPDIKDRLSESDKAALREWIEAGAPPLLPGRKREFVTQAQVNDLILADLEKIDRRARRFQRYFTFTHLFNAGAGDDELRTYRNALSKLISSLSWHPKVRNPEPIDPHGTVFRIDLRWFMWDATLWNRILQDYPYGVLDDGVTSRVISVFAASKVPVIRGDWFVATASRPPLYQDVLQLPGNLAELERQLRVDAGLNIAQERVMRVAFNGSGISKNNRVLERHDAVHGYYWRTYDFEEVPQNLADRGLQAPDRRNVFAYPLGPGSVENTFLHAGGEAIFSLPNGLQGYFIMNSVNNRLDKAPTAIVSDPKRSDKAVELGISCMGCHIPGIHPKADQMHDHLTQNPKAISKADADVALALYPPKKKSLAQMEEDAKKFQVALALTGTQITRFEPILAMTIRYEGDIDGVSAAAEAGLPWEEFQKRVGETEALSRPLGSLRVSGGTVARQVWVQTFGDVVRELRLGALFQTSQIGASLPDNTGELDPLEVSAGQVNQMVFTSDGRRAVLASADRSIRSFDVEGRRDLKRFVGHTASVWAVTLSPDGKQALSGGMDGTARLWDVETGRQLQKLDGHTGLVTAAAFALDNHAVTGGLDGFVILWDLETGREIRRWRGPMKYVSALAVAPDGRTTIIAADRTLRLWNLDNGNQDRVYDGHVAPVTAVAFSADGTRIISGSDDRTVRLWETATAKPIQILTGHDGAIRSVALSADGKWAITAAADATVRLWQLSDGKDAAVFRKHGAPVVRAAFAGNGRQTVSGDRDGTVLIWNIDRFLPKGK